MIFLNIMLRQTLKGKKTDVLDYMHLLSSHLFHVQRREWAGYKCKWLTENYVMTEKSYTVHVKIHL